MPTDDTAATFAEALCPKAVAAGEYTFSVPSSFSFGPRIFGGMVTSIAHKAVKDYFATVRSTHDQSDVLQMQWQFMRALTPAEASIKISELHVGKSASSVQVMITQNSKPCMAGMLNIINFSKARGITFEIPNSLNPEATPASLRDLENDADARWISVVTPYHPKGFRKAHSYIKFFVPCDLQDPSYKEQWLTPYDPQNLFTNETISYIADISFPLVDNYFPGTSTGSHSATLAVALQQKARREKGLKIEADSESSSYKTPVMIVSQTMSLEIKKLLPPEGVKWLYLRTVARQIINGRLSMDVIIMDEHGDLVATGQHICPIIDLRRQMGIKPNM